MSKKVLVTYFSASGQTARLAKTLAAAAGADLYEITPEVPYTSADLNWRDKGSRSSLEMTDPSSRPAVAGCVDNMAQYDAVFVGFPIWWGQAPTIVQTFLEQYDLTGKTLISFATSGGSGMGKTDSILKTSAPNALWKPGKLLSAGAGEKELAGWVAQLGL